jgi:hypothetical protein
MPTKEILEMCEQTIRNDLGSLDDIPHELANTIANAYYRYLSYVKYRANPNHPGWLPKEMKRETDPQKGLRAHIEEYATIKTDFDAAIKFVELLRSIDKHKQPRYYQFLVDFILDCLKYDIKNAQTKSGLRRMIERKLSTAKDREIPNLIDLL